MADIICGRATNSKYRGTDHDQMLSECGKELLNTMNNVSNFQITDKKTSQDGIVPKGKIDFSISVCLYNL